MSEEENQQPSQVDGQSALPREESAPVVGAHKSSNLRRRWKRKVVASAGATIREDDAQAPKEVKTVTIEHAERLNFAKERQRALDSYEHRSNQRQRGDACGHKAACKCRSDAHHSLEGSIERAKKHGCHGQQEQISCMCRSFWSKTKRFVCELLAFPAKNPKKCCSQHRQPSAEGDGAERAPRPHRYRRHRRRASDK
jgi:hypothetical protein